jgi:predicted RNA-binding protein (virulence factor B family)
MSVQVGSFQQLSVQRLVPFGAYLDDGGEGILLPLRFMPTSCKVGDVLPVFVYHDSENRLIATTQKPYGVVGEIVNLTAVNITEQGAFMDNGLMKDLFVPKSQQLHKMIPNGKYLVKIFIDKQTGRMTGTEKFESSLSNEELTVTEKEEVHLTAFRRTDLGYIMIVNHRHTGLLYFNEIFQSISVGQSFNGFVKKVYQDTHNLDLMLGKMGYARVQDESSRILSLLEEAGGFLPYHDKSDPDLIYEIFGMSKKTFKMSLGGLFKKQIIRIGSDGIHMVKK